MKEYTLKKDSWHYKIAKFDNYMIEWCTDICQYIRAFTIGLIKIIFLAIGFGVLAGFFLYGIGNIIGVLFFGYMIEPAAIVPISVFLSLIILSVIVKIKEYYKNRPKVGREPGFVGLAYDKFKNKTCARIKFE